MFGANLPAFFISNVAFYVDYCFFIVHFDEYHLCILNKILFVFYTYISNNVLFLPWVLKHFMKIVCYENNEGISKFLYHYDLTF